MHSPHPRHFTCVETPFPYTRPCPLLRLRKNVGVFIKQLIRAIQQPLPWDSNETLAWILDSDCAKFKIWSKFPFIYTYFYNSSGDLYWPKSYGDINRYGEKLGTNAISAQPKHIKFPIITLLRFETLSTKTINTKRNTRDKWTAVIQELKFH